MELGFYFDQSRCTDCKSCSIVCTSWHDLPVGVQWLRVDSFEIGKFPNVRVVTNLVSCWHCEDPRCVKVCPNDAISKRSDNGIVVVDSEKCRVNVSCGIIPFQNLPSGLIYEEIEAPCKIDCPAKLSVSGYIALIAKGNFKEALDLIREEMPLPAVSGRICNHPCESECKRQDIDEPIAIAALKRFVSDYVIDRVPALLPIRRKEKIAIVGSGPAGLAAAYDLIKEGYAVTIFEALPVAGGMLAVGIPEYRLPKRVLQREIDYIKGLGVEIRTNTPIGDGLTIDDLATDGYAAIFIAVGAHRGKKLSIPGADLEGTLIGVSFLRDVNLGKEVKIGQKVVVLGGGSVAFDCARTSIRLGAAEVHLTCLESQEKMPAESSEIEQGKAEGIVIHPSRSFTKILGKDGHVIGVECLNLRWMEFDEEGQVIFEAIKGSEHLLSADTVIFAVGQAPDLGLISGVDGIKITKQGTIAFNPETLETGRPGVFTGGDAVSGPAWFINAIADGKKAAVSIERYLQGEVLEDGCPTDVVKSIDIKVEIPADIKKLTRQKMHHLPVAERIRNFAEVALNFTEEMAIAEAGRCLNCAGHLCKDVCPYSAPQFGNEIDAMMQMCDFCLDRLAEKKNPICVNVCTTRALDFGPLEELKKRYGDIKDTEGFIYLPKTKPSVVFKSKVV